MWLRGVHENEPHAKVKPEALEGLGLGMRNLAFLTARSMDALMASLSAAVTGGICAQALRAYGKPLAHWAWHAAIAGYVIAFLSMLPTTKAGFAADCKPWRDLLVIPGGIAMIVVTVHLLLLRSNAISTANTIVPHR